MSELERSYRRLLRAYPRGDRRDEILTTLLDAAAPDRQRPTWRERADLLAGGLRARLTVPRGPANLVIAVTAVLLGAVAGAALGGWATWPAPPSQAEARSVAAVALDQPVVAAFTMDDPVDVIVSGTPAGAAPTYVEVVHALPVGARPGAVAAARDRLVAAGWRLGPTEAAAGSDAFTARRGDLVLRIELVTDRQATDATILLHRRASGAGGPAAVLAGALAGLLAAWFLVAWALRRWRRHAAGTRGRLIRGVAIPSLFVTGVLTVLALLETGVPTAYEPYAVTGVLLASTSPLPYAAGAGLAAVLVLLATMPKPVPEAPPTPLPAVVSRLVAGLHRAFASAAALVVVLFVARMAAAGADRGDMLSGAYDPKELIPFGGSDLNPAFWLYAAVAVLFPLGLVASPGLLAVTVPLLVAGRRSLARPTYRLLAVGAVSAVAVGLLPFTAFGGDVIQWWLD